MKAADEEFWAKHPELNRRRLTTALPDKDLRSEWMSIFRNKLARLEARRQNQNPPRGDVLLGNPVQHCVRGDLLVHVTNKQTGSNLTGVEVQLTSGPDARCPIKGMTGADGRVDFLGIAVGQYIIEASKALHLPHPARQTGTAQCQPTTVDLQLRERTVLGIHSNAAADANYTAGHAWITVTRDGVTTSYGLWPDSHPDIQARGLDNGSGSDIRVGIENNFASKADRYYVLTEDQDSKLDAALKENITWRYTNTCASWASETIYAVTGEDVDADDYMGFETPREITRSIQKLEKSNPTSAGAPHEPAQEAGSSQSSI
jgi:hypothetical protein